MRANRGGALSDQIGRNKAIIFGGFWGLLGSSLQVAAQNSDWMLCARILAGVGTGVISAVIPVWSSELVAHDSRGMVIAFEMVVNYAGISSACKSDAVCQDALHTLTWKFAVLKIGSNTSCHLSITVTRALGGDVSSFKKSKRLLLICLAVPLGFQMM